MKEEQLTIADKLFYGRIIVKAYERHTKFERMSLAADMDAHFDGGEWSGPAHAEMFEEEERKFFDKVAKQLGIESNVAWDAWMLHSYSNRWFNWNTGVRNVALKGKEPTKWSIDF